ANSNYWVDALFTTVAPPDTTAPTVVGIVPAASTVEVATDRTIQVTFSEALSAASVTSANFELRDASNTVVASSVAYDGNKTVTGTQTSRLANATIYTLTVKGGSTGVKDTSDNALAANVASSFTTAISDVTYSLWSSAAPAQADSGDKGAVELGVKFTTT